MGPNDVANAQAVPAGPTPTQLLDALLVNQHVGIDIREGNVVLGVVRRFPQVQRPSRVQHGPGSQGCADPPRNRLDVIDRRDHLRIVRHRGLLQNGAGAAQVL